MPIGFGFQLLIAKAASVKIGSIEPQKISGKVVQKIEKSNLNGMIIGFQESKVKKISVLTNSVNLKLKVLTFYM